MMVREEEKEKSAAKSNECGSKERMLERAMAIVSF